MDADGKIKLSEAANNIIENLAFRLAAMNKGRITPNNVIPYLPVSLEIVKSCLDNMVDGISVISEQVDNITEYNFSAYKDGDKVSNPKKACGCVSCDSEIPSPRDGALCAHCFEALKKELNVLADKMGWPAQAVYEHEILYIAANHGHAQHAGTLAGHSKLTLKKIREKLERLSLGGYVQENLSDEQDTITYRFPEIEYPRNLYKKNMDIIRTYPASVMEETEVKVARILFSLGFIVLGLLVLAFFHFPLPWLALLFLIAAPLSTALIWRHRNRLEDK